MHEVTATLRELHACKEQMDALRRKAAEAQQAGDVLEVMRLKEQMQNVVQWAEWVAQEIG